MGVLFLLGMMAFIAGLCHLFVPVVRWSIRGPRGDRWETERRRPVVLWDVPATVPAAWVEAYRPEHGG